MLRKTNNLNTHLVTYLSQTGEHFAHGLVVQTLRAVDDDDIHSKGFSEILDGLCLACPGGTLGASPAV